MSEFKIAVICGGQSAEAGVSRSSAAGVVAALKENFKSVTLIELDADMPGALLSLNPDVVFPVLHGPPGEDGTIQGFFEMMKLPYVGSDVHSSAVAMDKVIAKAVFERAGLPTASHTVVNRKDGNAKAVEQIQNDLGERVVVKPARQGSALGVTLVDNANQLHAAVETAFEFDAQLLVETRIDGREMTVGVIDKEAGSEAFDVIEITTPENSWYDFEHRYTAGLSEHLLPADVPDNIGKRLKEISVAAHQALGCRDLSRADLILAGDDIFLLEVNTLPGMTPTSLYPDAANHYGLDFPALVKYFVERAAARGI